MLIRSRDNPILDDISKVVEEYFYLANAYVNNIEYADSVILGLKSLNTLIDNRDLNDFYEFENPHSNLMFSGCCTALLSTYSVMAKRAFEFIKNENSEKKHYYPYITSDGYAEVSAKELFEGNEKCFLINIRIPTELMFDFKNLVCFILHEIGHYWEFFAYDPDYLLDFYLDLSLKQHLITSQDEKNVYTSDEVDAIRNFALNINTDKSSFEIFKCLSLSFDKKQGNKNIFDVFELVDNVIEDITSFDKAILEAIADIFMIKFIGIKSVTFYLNVVFDYLRYKNIAFVSSKPDWQYYLSNFFLRVTIVLLFLLAEDLTTPDKTFNLLISEIKKYGDAQNMNSKVAESKKQFVNQLDVKWQS